MSKSPLSYGELGHMLRQSRPPNGWGKSKVLAVAYSGGADSTCLLYLLRSWLLQREVDYDGPSEVVALSVDHSLQPKSADTAERCRQFAQRFNIPFRVLTIPWSQPPFPNRPLPGKPFETVAREARYRILFTAMKELNATVLATGHHGDDNVETLLMRLSTQNEGSLNFTAMRRCRRWGMTLEDEKISSMHHWIVRPLLSVPKSRILATCDLHNLPYVNDPTNFQPLLTPRNYIRHYLLGGKTPVGPSAELPRINVKQIERSVNKLDALTSGLSRDMPMVSRLQVAANVALQSQHQIDDEVTRFLLKTRRQSAPSTLAFQPYIYDRILAPQIQRAIVLRILRFISPKPWGTPAAEAFRGSTNLQKICHHLWNSHSNRKPFTLGSEVLWRPITFVSDGEFQLAQDGNELGNPGWLASRQPPIKRHGISSPCEQDITSVFMFIKTEQVILWDNRFVITLRPWLLPEDIQTSIISNGTVLVVPHSNWLLPKIVCLYEGRKPLLLGGVGLKSPQKDVVGLDSDWVTYNFIRSLEAI
ncbi:hypothetical protein BU17DRAFT_49709 [Hysterangium stoloniferum]|nr:hypothetical protein BU17DRAFT_49709 [Hysterangium stoloniferum]